VEVLLDGTGVRALMRAAAAEEDYFNGQKIRVRVVSIGSPTEETVVEPISARKRN